MWVLESDGDALKGKKLWLRPGKKFIFGRTQSEVGQFIVSDKTISRQHLTVEVEEVQPADCANIRTRSRVTLEDLNARIGTLLNGEQIRGQRVVLQQPDNIVILGKYKHHFRFTWVPVVFSYMFTSKELKANPWIALHERLGPLDIKVLQDFQPGVTTHVVAKKRNTSKGLQALIGGRHIVYNDSFAQALVMAATSVDGPAPLEVDFEANFPDPLQYLPPKGEEPTERDQSSYAPNPARQDMFEGYTFVFYEKRQYDNLFAPISEGGGKVSLMQAIPQKTNVDDFVGYVKGLAGEKGLGSFDDGTEGKGVIVVRFNPVKGDASLTEWYAEFGRNVAMSLDHRLIEQNEFLDAILGNDASVLRRPLEIELSGVVAPPPTAATNVSIRAPQSSAPGQATQASMAPPSAPDRRGRSRRTGKKFIGFDDDDFSGPPASSIPESAPESMVVDPLPVVESQHSQGLFVTQNPDMEIHREISPMPESQDYDHPKRKRSPSPLFEESEEEDLISRIVPPAPVKKQKLDQGKLIAKPVPAPKSQVPKLPPQKVIKQEINVVEITRRKNEEAATLAAAEREALEQQLEGIDIEQIRNLAIIEEMPVTRKPPPIRTARADESDRWNDKWNGRKDFGRFRRRGATNVRSNQRVIVALEEAKNKDYGIGIDRWDGETESQRKKKKDKGRESQTQNTGGSHAASRARQILASEAEDDFDASDPESEPEVAPEPEKEASSSDLEELVIPPSRAGRAKATAAAAAASSSRTSRSQKSVSSQQASSTQGSRKRVAPPAASSSRQPPAKKQKQLGLLRKGARSEDENEDEDSDDEMKFKFRRPRK